MIRLGEELTRDCVSLENRVGNWSKSLKARLKAVHREVGVRWKGEAQRRVPVDTGFLKTKLMHNVYDEQQYVYVTEVGTNIPEYPVYLEFGTRFIAGGAVLALGDSTGLTDQDAIHMWPAKAEGLAGMGTGVSSTEQMPYIRPAFNSIREWVIDSLNQTAVVPPRTQ